MSSGHKIFANPRAFLTKLFDVAVKAGNPHEGIKSNLPDRPKGRIIVVGAGKASVQMAEAFEALWGDPLTGAVVARHGTIAKLEQIKLLTAAHPVPDAAGSVAANHLLTLVQNLTSDDLVVALISGGGSALLPAPELGLTLKDEIQLNKILLRSGAPITAMNAIRKQISRIKGGRLAWAAAPARVVTYVVSDIPGDVLSQVSSGPTIPDGISLSDAMAFIQKYDIRLPAKLKKFLATARGSPVPGNPVFVGQQVHLVASAQQSLRAAASYAKSLGIPTYILSDAIEGETHHVAKMHAAIACAAQTTGQPFHAPCLLLSGGETTVTLGRGDHGKGGRNAEFALSFATAIAERKGIFCLAADTDGIDGSEDNAGGWADGETINRVFRAGTDPGVLLTNHDSWTALKHADDLFVTGPTGTNVNDFRAVLIDRTK